MLTSDQLDALTVPITDLYEEYMDTVIQDIARRLVKMGKPTATAAWQLQRLQESGKVYENAIQELSKLTGQSEKVLKETFEQAGVQTMRFDERVYKAAGLNPLPLHLSPAMARVLSAGLQKTGGLINNLTMTTANSAQQAFIHAADIAYMQVTTGTMSYDEAIRRAIKGVGDSGLEVFYPTGHRDKLDVAMRRTVLTGVSQTAGQIQWARMDELGVDLVQVSAHIGARPEHQAWQGKIFSRSGTDPEYPDFVSSTGYGTGAGLGGWNCRHSFYAFFKGISKPIYDQATTDEYQKKTVTYNGQQVPIYEATQIQRGIERKIRAWKRQASALEAGGLSNVKEIGKVREWQETMRDFIKQTGLQRQGVRERIVLPEGGQPKIFKVTEKPKPPRPPKVPNPVVPEVPQVPRGSDVRKSMLDFKDSAEQKAFDALIAEQDQLARKLDELAFEHPDRASTFARYSQITFEKDELKKMIDTKVRGLLAVDDPTDIIIRHTTKEAHILETQKRGVDFWRSIVSRKINMQNTVIKLSRAARAYYDPQKIAVVVGRYSGSKTIVHELGHHLELSGGLLDKVTAFYEKRTKGESLQSLKSITGIGYRSNEKTRKDDFLHPYMGKEYKTKSGQWTATEIVSMGLEYLYSDPIYFAEKDPEYFEFIIDLIRGIN